MTETITAQILHCDMDAFYASSVRIKEITRYLEMTAPGSLRPAMPPRDDIELGRPRSLALNSTGFSTRPLAATGIGLTG